MVAQFSAPASCPAKSAFFRFNAMGLMVRSTEHDDAPATSAYRRLTALTVPTFQRGGHWRRDRAARPRFDRVRRSASRLPRQSVLCRYGDLDQLTPGMRPTLGQPDVGTGTIRGDQAVISSVTVRLKDACEPLQYTFGMVSTATGSIGEGYTGWPTPAPRSVITGQRPEVSRFGFAGARIEDWRTGLVHEQLGGPLQIGDQSVEDRAKLECRLADQVGERRAVEINALAAHDLGLPVER